MQCELLAFGHLPVKRREGLNVREGVDIAGGGQFEHMLVPDNDKR